MFLQGIHRAAGVVGGLLPSLTAELDQEPAPTIGQELHAARMDIHRGHIIDQPVVDPFERGGAIGHDLGHVITGRVDIRIAEHQERARGRTVDEPHRGLQDHHAAAFGAHQGARDVEAVLGQELIEGIARDPARDLRDALPYWICVAVAQLLQPLVDLPAPTAFRDDAVELLVGGCPDARTQPIIGEDLEFLDVIGGQATHDRVRTAGVVAEHPAQGIVSVRGRVRGKGEAVSFGARRRSSSTVPGSSRASLRSGSSARIWRRYFDMSMITATLQHWPQRLVPPPRERTGAPCFRQRAIVSTTSSMVRGTTMPIGTWR